MSQDRKRERCTSTLASTSKEIPSGVQPIEAVSTSTALIIGYATKGPVNAPTLLFSFDQYVTQFGGIADFAGSPTGLTVDYMGHTVGAFFAGDDAAVAARIPQRTNCGDGWRELSAGRKHGRFRARDLASRLGLPPSAQSRPACSNEIVVRGCSTISIVQ